MGHGGRTGSGGLHEQGISAKERFESEAGVVTYFAGAFGLVALGDSGCCEAGRNTWAEFRALFAHPPAVNLPNLIELDGAERISPSQYVTRGTKIYLFEGEAERRGQGFPDGFE
jgi:hypothetical protein